MKTHSRNISLDFAKTIGIIGVIMIHVFSPVVVNDKIYFSSLWITALFIDTFSKISVPLFFMVSGALLLDPAKHEESYLKFIQKRFLKIIGPFLFWSLIYFAWRAIFKNEELTALNMLVEMITGGVYFHFWFIYVIIGIYIFIPFIRKSLKVFQERDIELLIMLWIGFITINVIVHFFTNQDIGIKLPVLTDYLGYFIVGYYLTHSRVKKSIKRPWWIIFFAILVYACTILLILILMKYFNYKIPRTLNSYLSPNIIVLSIAVFFLFIRKQAVQLRSNAFSKYFEKFSNNSYGIFLAHVLVLEIARILFKTNSEVNFLHLLLYSLFTLLVSFILVDLIRKVPVIGRFLA